VETATAVGAGRRRIIKRPRLTRMLDESGARIVLLVAPAGYGKTTLAQEWLGEDVRRAAWYRGGPASADVAALAVGLAEATSEIVPGAGDHMRERLRATDRPEEEARLLAEMLAEDLGEWPADAWLAFDDYQFAMDSAAAEEFVNTLAGDAPLQLVITSRRRPTWASARRRLYGEVVEVDRTLLAMSDPEALEVLDPAGSDASDLLAVAGGWPAVIGLAALSGELTTPNDAMLETLYDYFADELFQAAEPEVRLGLCKLALLPTISAGLPELLFDREPAMPVIRQGIQIGVLIPSLDSLDLHPLLRNFLTKKLLEFGEETASKAVRDTGRLLLERQLWDDVFALAERFEASDLLAELIEASREQMFVEGRLATLARWIEYAAERQISSPSIDLAEAEIAFRQAEYPKAENLAIQAARRMPHGTFHVARAYSRAGQSAHFQARDDRAYEYHRLAEKHAVDSMSLREALWGQFISLLELEDEGMEGLLARLASISGSSADEVLRLAAGRFMLAVRFGAGLPDDQFAKIHLVSRARDPLIRSSFLNLCGGTLTFAGRYEEALDIANQQLGEAERFRLGFVLPHAYIRLATSYLGLREFARGFGLLEQAHRSAETTADSPLRLTLLTVRMRGLLATGRTEEALSDTSAERFHQGPISAFGEYLACRALALAAGSRPREAFATSELVFETTRSIEAVMLARFASVIASISLEREDAGGQARAAFQTVADTGCVDCLVTAYRTCPDLLLYLKEVDNSLLARILLNARDGALAKRAGLPHFDLKRGSFQNLSSREQEVLDLLAQGLSNKEIARTLFIAESTAKVHVRHILEKLGVRSRTEAVLRTRDFVTRASN
jgi:LuxR family transcriptional regulator, maltose regulon positive regulatory protein